MKQETIEETAKRLYEYQSQNPPYTIITPKAKIEGFIEGAKWQQEQDKNKYSKEDMLNFAWFLIENIGQYSCDRTAHFEGKYLEQFKKK